MEQDDWGAGTTRWSTRLIHGGLRYLEHGEVGLVRESLAERERLLRTAAHLVRPLHLVIPVRRTSPFGLARLRAGMVAYDLLSLGKSLDRHRMLGRTAAAAFEPGIALEGLRGAAVYADAQVPLVERLCVENALDAAAHGAACHTHTRVDGLLLEDGRVAGVRCTDALDGSRRTLRAPVVANMAGPWVDRVRRLGDAALPLRLGGTRGCHLVLPVWDGAPREALYVAARSDGRPFEICRWRRWMLVGTTDEPFDGDPGRVPVEPWEVDYLLAEVNAEFPRARLGRDDVLFTTGGQRPLLREEGKAPGEITRSHTIADGAAEGLPGLLSAIGGKVTTYRQLAEEVVDRVVAATGRPARACDTATARLPGAPDPGVDAVLWRERTILELAGGDVARETAEHLVDAYGTRAAAVVERRPPSRSWRTARPGPAGAGRGGRARRGGGGRPHGRGRRLPAHARGPDAGRRRRRAVARGAALRGALRLGRGGRGGRRARRRQPGLPQGPGAAAGAGRAGGVASEAGAPGVSGSRHPSAEARRRGAMAENVRVSSNGRVTIPKEIRDRLGLGRATRSWCGSTAAAPWWRRRGRSRRDEPRHRDAAPRAGRGGGVARRAASTG